MLVQCHGLFPGVRVADMGGEEIDYDAGGVGIGRQQGRDQSFADPLHL